MKPNGSNKPYKFFDYYPFMSLEILIRKNRNKLFYPVIPLFALNFFSNMAVNEMLKNGYYSREKIERSFAESYNHVGFLGDVYIFLTRPGREFAYYVHELNHKKS